MAQQLEAALMNVPVLRTMLALDQFDQGQKLAQGREVMQVMEVLKDLAAMQSLPEMNRLRRAQANKAEYDVEQLRERDRLVGQAAERRLTPRELQGPQLPGQGALTSQPDFSGFVMDMLKHPATAEYGAGVAKAVTGEFKSVPRGGQLHNLLTGETIQGKSGHQIAQTMELMRQALEDGDTDTFEYAKSYLDRLTTRGTGDRARFMEEALRIVEKGQASGLDQKEMDRLQAIQGYLSSRQVIQTPYGPQVIEGMEIPAISDFLRGRQSPTSGAQGVPRQTMLTPGSPPPAPPGQKDLSTSDTEKLKLRGTYTQQLEALVKGFEPAFTNEGGILGKISKYDPTGISGTIRHEASSRGVTDEAFANWWSGIKSLFAVERHELFGATLTPPEQQAFRELVAASNSSPTAVKALLDRMYEMSKSEQERYKEGLRHNDAKAVAGILGEGRPNPFVYGRAATEKARREVQGAQKPRQFKATVTYGGQTRKGVDVREYPGGRKEFFWDGRWRDEKEE